MSEKDKLKRYSYIGIGLLLAGALFFYLGIHFPIAGVIGVFMMIGGGLSLFLSQLCPHCHQPMRHRLDNTVISDYCPHCGKKIE